MAVVAQGQELIMIFTASSSLRVAYTSFVICVLIKSVILMILLFNGNNLVYIFQFYDRLNVHTGHYTPLPCGSAPLKRSLRDYMS